MPAHCTVGPPTSYGTVMRGLIDDLRGLINAYLAKNSLKPAQLFNRFDLDHQGSIDKVELNNGLGSIGIDLKDHQQLDIIWNFMSKGNAMVDRQLWQKFLSPLPVYSFRQLEDKYMHLSAAKNLGTVGRLKARKKEKKFVLSQRRGPDKHKTLPLLRSKEKSRKKKKKKGEPLEPKKPPTVLPLVNVRHRRRSSLYLEIKIRRRNGGVLPSQTPNQEEGLHSSTSLPILVATT